MRKPAAPLFCIALGLGALALTACAPTLQDSQWTGAANAKQNKVLYLRETHDVHFDPGKETLSPAERERLAAFLTDDEVGRTDEVTLAAGGTGGGREGALAARRAESVAEFLRGRNLKSATHVGAPAPADSVTVTVGRYVVVPPHCPDWRKPSDDDPANSPSSNIGCATETNLGLMVADPRDLVTGKTVAPADAEHAAFGVERYRLGTYKQPHDAYEKTPDDFAKGTGIPLQTK